MMNLVLMVICAILALSGDNWRETRLIGDNMSCFDLMLLIAALLKTPVIP